MTSGVERNVGIVARREFQVGWGDCAPSGAVFYPNYFRWFDQGLWDLFDKAGHPIVEMERRYHTVGIPLVDMQVSFLRPCRLQYRVALESEVIEWQPKRFRVRHRLSREGDVLVECVETRFWGIRHPDNPERLVSTAIPAEIVAAFSQGDPS